MAERHKRRDSGMVFVADDLAAWLIAALADSGRKRLAALILGTEQQRALRKAAATAVRRTAADLRPDDAEQAEHLAMVIDQVFNTEAPSPVMTERMTLLEALGSGIAAQLAVLDDVNFTGTGKSSSEVLEVPAEVLAEKLTGYLVREILVQGAGGGPLTPLADQLNHNVTQLQGELSHRADQRLEGMLDRLTEEVRAVLARLQDTSTAMALLEKAYQEEGNVNRLDAIKSQLASTLDRLPGSADQASISLYLAAMASWLNMDPWPQDNRFEGPVLIPAAIERKLKLVDSRRPTKSSVDADNVAATCERLVVLGAPGSGKTWLARRIARRCAENALFALANGALIGEVELPLYTTCSRLFTAEGVIREAAISSALQQLGDLGGFLTTASIQQHLLERDGPILLVVDSLDEAYGSDERLRQIDTLPWRVVLTTRPSSWNGQLRIRDHDEAHCIGELLPLRYPDDIDAFIRHWFEEWPDWAENLIGQIARRPDLQRAATVPLILAFYCIVGGRQSLPGTRRELYTEVITRILTGRWRGSHVNNHRQYHVGICLQTLRDWAWSGTFTQSRSGVGIWKDDLLTEPNELNEVDAQALDHVAVPVGSPELRTGKILRRFIHRSIREHLVAEYVANLPANQAAQILLPHLWYDRDWQYAAPSAVAMHSRRDQLLRELMHLAGESGQASASIRGIEAGWELRQFLARVAAQSNEMDWSREMARIIGRARVDLAISGPVGDLGASSWQNSSRKARDALLRTLNNPDELVAKDPADLVDAFTQLATTEQEKQSARENLLKLSVNQEDSYLIASLLGGVARLNPTIEDLRQSRTTLLRLLPHETDERSVLKIVDITVRLAATEEDKRRARKELRNALVNSRGNWTLVYPVVSGIVQLATTIEEKHQARATLLDILDDERDGFAIERLVDGVMRLDPTAEDLRQVREVILSSLSSQRTGRRAGSLVTTLIQLAPTTQEKGQARRSLLHLLSSGLTNRFGSASEVANALPQLDPTAEDRRLAREALCRRLAYEEVWLDAEGSTIVNELTFLGPTAEEKHLVRDLLLGMLPNHTSYLAGGMVTGLISILTTPEEKRDVRRVLIKILATHSDYGLIGPLAGGIAKLEPSPKDLQEARNILMRTLVSQTDGYRADHLTYYLLLLNPSATDKQRARNTFAGILEDPTNEGSASTIASRLIELAETAEDKRLARDVLLKWVARRIQRLEGADPNPVMDKIAQLNPTVRDLRACDSWLIPPSNELLAAVRQNSELADWIAFLPSLSTQTY